MLRIDPKNQFHAEFEHRQAFLSLRWLLAILASYLTLFSYLGSENFPMVFGFALLFSGSNIVLALAPKQYLEARGMQRAIALVDFVFVSATLYLLRGPETYLYLGLIAIFLLAVLWYDLRLVLFSLFVVSLLYGVFRYFRLFGFELEVDIEQFLTLSLFFVVSIFYIFLVERLREDARLAKIALEEKRNAEIMVEITRALSSSLKSDEVLLAIVSRLGDVLSAEECSIVRIDPQTGIAEVMVKSSDPALRNAEIQLSDYPELKQAFETRSLLFNPDAKPTGVVAIPMVSQNTVLGLIYLRTAHLGSSLSDANERFFEVMASTAANALRNAQLFEEVEHRSRTDFLTGLPNHRFFQATLSVELGRAQRHNHALSLLIIDLDFLKEVNDRFGHPSGDLMIRTVADTIRQSCREIDFAARYGGEEFTVILPETPLAGAIQVADRIREKIAAEEVTGIGSITASIGVSNYPVNALTKEDLIRVADQALYVAKNRGRDRVAYFSYQMITK